MSLLEVSVAIALLAGGVMATVGVVDASARAAESGRQRTDATALAERELESMRSLEYDTVGLSAAAPGYVASFEGSGTVTIDPAAITPTSVVTGDGIAMNVRRHVTWASVTAGDGTTVDDAYKHLVVIVTWVDDGTRTVRLDGGLSPFTQRLPCVQAWVDPAPPTVTGVVNTYWPGRADAAAGATRVDVDPPIGAPIALRTGDLMLLVQTGGANAGAYEYAMATTDDAGGVIGVTGAGAGGGLVHGYDALGGFQIVRVPTYPDVTVAGLTGAAWNGRAGGLVAIDVAGTLTLAGDVVGDALGPTTPPPPGFADSAAALLPGGGDGTGRGGALVMLRAELLAGTGGVFSSGAVDGGTIVVASSGDGSDVWTAVTGARDGGAILSGIALGTTDVAGGVMPGTVDTTLEPSSLVGLPVGVGCRPAIAVTKTTTTPLVLNATGGTADYVIEVGNGPGRGEAAGAEVGDVLPAGLTYAATTGVDLLGGATRTSPVDPTIGDLAPRWGTFTIPPGATVRVRFRVTVPSAVPPSVLDNDAHVTYSTLGGLGAADYRGPVGVGENVTVTPS